MTKLSLNPSNRDSNRRVSRRFQSSTRIRFAVSDGDASVLLSGCIADVSRTGLRIVFNRAIAIDQQVTVQFGDIDSADSLSGRTIWCERLSRNEFVVGCELDRKLSIPEYIALCDFARLAQDLEAAS